MQDSIVLGHSEHDESESRSSVMAESAPVMIWMARADRLCDGFNKPWLAFTGRTLEEECGRGWFDSVHPEDRDSFIGIYNTSFDARQPFELDCRLRRHDGGYRWVLLQGVPRNARDGSFEGYTGCCIDIHDRREMEEHVAEHASAMRVADRRKDEFLRLLAHELRNPLAPIASAVGTLQLMERDSPPLMAVRQIVERQLEQLRRVVSDMVEVTRVSRSRIVLRKETLRIDEVVRSAVQSAGPLLDNQAHTLRISVPDEPVLISGDMARIAQALFNLISNAVKFTHQPGVITVAVESDSRMVHIRVKDPGQGIRREFLPRIFDPFAQEDPTQTRLRGGLGVGLTIARRIAQLHGGGVKAFSDGPQQGAEFILSLPLQSSETAASETDDARAAAADRLPTAAPLRPSCA